MFYNESFGYAINKYWMHILWRNQVNVSKIARFICKKPKKIDKSNYLKSTFSLKKVHLKCYSSLNFQYFDPKYSEQVYKSISLLSTFSDFWIFVLLIFYSDLSKISNPKVVKWRKKINKTKIQKSEKVLNS